MVERKGTKREPRDLPFTLELGAGPGPPGPPVDTGREIVGCDRRGSTCTHLGLVGRPGTPKTCESLLRAPNVLFSSSEVHSSDPIRLDPSNPGGHDGQSGGWTPGLTRRGGRSSSGVPVRTLSLYF